MRDIDTIINDIELLMSKPDIELDPTAPVIFKKLHIELLQASGFTVNKTKCPKCNQVLDKDQEQGKNWEFVYEDGTGQIIFTCDRCDIKVPMDVEDPNEKAHLN